jgi:hypothetical protein
MGEHEGHSDLHVIVGRYDTNIFEDAHVLQDPPPLVISLIAHDETVEHTLMDCGDKYISGEDTSIWDPGLVDTHDEDTFIHDPESIDIHGLIDIVVHPGYRMVPKDIGVCSGIQRHTMMSSCLQWHAEVYSGAHGVSLECRAEAYLMEHGDSSGEHFAPLPQYVDLGDHIINNRSTYDDRESRVDHQGEETTLDAYDGIGVAWSPSDYSDSPSVCREEFLVIPLGLTNVCDTF